MLDMKYIVKGVNVPQGLFTNVTSDSESGAWFLAWHLSKQENGVSFMVYRVSRDEGTVAIASFLNGEKR